MRSGQVLDMLVEGGHRRLCPIAVAGCLGEIPNHGFAVGSRDGRARARQGHFGRQSDLNRPADATDIIFNLVHTSCIGLVACLLRKDRLDLAFDGGERWNAELVQRLCVDKCGSNLEPIIGATLDARFRR